MDPWGIVVPTKEDTSVMDLCITCDIYMCLPRQQHVYTMSPYMTYSYKYIMKVFARIYIYIYIHLSVSVAAVHVHP